MRALRIHAAASAEAAAAAAWYDQQRPGLGADFLRAVDAALDMLEQEVVPLTATGERGIKRMILRRFPFAIVVCEREDEMFVVAFAHQARRPGYWRNRLQER